VIDDDTSDDSADEQEKLVKVRSKSTEWMSIGSYRLSLAEKEMLTNNHCLNDLHRGSATFDQNSIP